MIKKRIGCGLGMARVLLLNLDDAELIASSLEKHGVNNVFVALQETPTNRRLALAAGLGRYACAGPNADRSLYEVLPAPTPKPKAKSKKAKVEAVVDEPTKEIQS